MLWLWIHNITDYSIGKVNAKAIKEPTDTLNTAEDGICKEWNDADYHSFNGTEGNII